MPRTLVLVPTDLERRGVAPALAPALGGSGLIELCGFGLVAAAARTAGLLARHRPAQVVLTGIAGRLNDRLAIGDAYRFDDVACFGIGAGSGDGFQTATSLGWSQWPGDPADPAAAIGDVLACASPATSAAPPAGLLLTVCAASASREDVAARKAIFPTAVAEDMEGFAVALACRLAGVPLLIVRGISNTAGDRDTIRWQIEIALAAAAHLTLRILDEPQPEPPR